MRLDLKVDHFVIVEVRAGSEAFSAVDALEGFFTWRRDSFHLKSFNSLDFYLPVWIRLWVFSELEVEKALLHSVQTFGFSPGEERHGKFKSIKSRKSPNLYDCEHVALTAMVDRRTCSKCRRPRCSCSFEFSKAFLLSSAGGLWDAS